MPTLNTEIVTASTANGTAFCMYPPQHGPAPTLLLLAMSGESTLRTEPYCCIGQRLHARGWNVISLDIPCHGADQREGEPAELPGWATRVATGEDFVAAFRTQVNEILSHLIAQGIADPACLGAAGTSRGGYLAFQAAAGNPLIRAVAAFSPVTTLLALGEFAALQAHPLAQQLALRQCVETLADRACWITIGSADARVDTDEAIAFTRALTQAAVRRDLPLPITLHLLPIPGHSSFVDWHNQAAEWLHAVVVQPPVD